MSLPPSSSPCKDRFERTHRSAAHIFANCEEELDRPSMPCILLVVESSNNRDNSTSDRQTRYNSEVLLGTRDFTLEISSPVREIHAFQAAPRYTYYISGMKLHIVLRRQARSNQPGNGNKVNKPGMLQNCINKGTNKLLGYGRPACHGAPRALFSSLGVGDTQPANHLRRQRGVFPGRLVRAPCAVVHPPPRARAGPAGLGQQLTCLIDPSIGSPGGGISSFFSFTPS